MNKVKVSVYHDTRKAISKKNEKDIDQYPVKLRVYFKEERQLYPTGVEISKEDFERSYLTLKPQKGYKDIKIKLQEIEAKANSILEDLKIFSFEGFEKKMFQATGDNNNIIYYYNQYIAQLKHENRISTANNYRLSLKSILSFAARNKSTEITHLSFETVTPGFLKDYEAWMLSEENSLTTVGIYIRPLRAIFNIGKTEGVVKEDIYPFGKRKFQIPAGRNVKKALSKEQLKKLFTYDVKPNSEQEKARDYWFFSYQCNGINFKDIAELKVGDIQGTNVIFTRAKTRNTSKSDSKKIVAPITDSIQSFIDKYSTGKTKNDYLFPIFDTNMTAENKHRVIQNFIRFVNQHVKIIAKAVGVDEKISTYWARHSYSTMAIRNGASMEYLQESLGHQDMKTTLNYFSGFEDKAKREVAKKLMDF